MSQLYTDLELLRNVPNSVVCIRYALWNIVSLLYTELSSTLHYTTSQFLVKLELPETEHALSHGMRVRPQQLTGPHEGHHGPFELQISKERGYNTGLSGLKCTSVIV